MDKIRIAFIGCGGMSSQLQQCIPMVPEFEFVATCDLVEEKAASNARRFGALRHYTDYNEMFKNEDLYAVAVVGRPEDKLHRDIGIACLQEGYHIYTEKPPATTAEGAKMLVDASIETGKTGMVGTMWRHAPAHQIAKQLMDEEEFGEAVPISHPIPRTGSAPSGGGIPLCLVLHARSVDPPYRLHAILHGASQRSLRDG